MIKFSIKIDDESHSLSKENGIDIRDIGGLLESLFDAIDNGTGNKITLGQIRGNCYALDFYSNDTGYLDNFILVHKNIEQIEIGDLQPEEQRYATKLKSILGQKYYLKAYDNDNTEVAAITEIGKRSSIGYYYTTDAIYGIVTELGSPSLSAKKHICVDGIPYKVYITKEQDSELKKYYSTQKLRVEVLQKRSSYDGHIIRSELESFVPISDKTLSDNLESEGYIDFELIKETNSIEDILNRIYANR